ncbi:MAG: RsbRD N-terminal domain-containing protein [Desulfobulbaceae bacterium]|uniref:RsbRD N-terminal domain-containing protein n=1 Tax=Candidatus Desulfatifera sulfidica TaxID=2841691 RepID=A0A8J6TCK6_9BACT|nr:RsbRD N-terminal domain-containing protein [Candidatus Desulfatifera sulfidica]
MELDEAFRWYREKIIDGWVAYTLETYESSSFFKSERDKFANPVGGNTREALSRLYNKLTLGADPSEFVPPLEQIMRIRAVQKFPPSQAVSPIHAIKHISRDIIEKNKETKHLIGQLYDFEFAVDLAVLAAFDLYMQCREQLYQVRIAEIKSGSFILTDSKCPSNMLKKDKSEPVQVLQGL